MDGYPEQYMPEKQNRKKRWLIGCGIGGLVTVCVVLFIVFGGFAGLLAIFGGDPEGLAVEVQTPASQLFVGDTFTITVELANEGTRNITISEIQIPNSLLEIALVTGVSPYATQGLNYGQKTAYEFDLLIAPNGRQKVEFSFEAMKAGDITEDVTVQVGTKQSLSGIRLVISPPASTAQDDTPVLGEIIPYQSVVQIIAIVDWEGQLIEGWTGSGTILSEDGLILTNAHVVLSDRYYNVVDLVVSITVEQDQKPVPMFYADVLQADAALDLAVIKVRSDLDGGPANFSSLAIPPVPLGNSDDLTLGDPLVIIGYPGIGGETITLTRGEVSGFTAEEPYGNRAFIKTSATIAGGNSGGLAATPQGVIIGVPTMVGSGDLDIEIVDCRRLIDTNRDGVIDELDACVPTGGFINALRPISLAIPMIDAAKAGEVAINEGFGYEEPQGDYEPEGDVVLVDTFDDNSNGWRVDDWDQASAQIMNGKLAIQIDSIEYYLISDLPDTYPSLIMATDIAVTNPVGDAEFGFICGLRDLENFTALNISEDGYYGIWKFENGEFIQLADWSYSEVIAAGGPYTLFAYCGPDSLALAVNETLLVETYDPNYSAGRVGVYVWPWDNPGVRVEFDNFTIINP